MGHWWFLPLVPLLWVGGSVLPASSRHSDSTPPVTLLWEPPCWETWTGSWCTCVPPASVWPSVLLVNLEVSSPHSLFALSKPLTCPALLSVLNLATRAPPWHVNTRLTLTFFFLNRLQLLACWFLLCSLTFFDLASSPSTRSLNFCSLFPVAVCHRSLSTLSLPPTCCCQRNYSHRSRARHSRGRCVQPCPLGSISYTTGETYLTPAAHCQWSHSGSSALLALDDTHPRDEVSSSCFFRWYWPRMCPCSLSWASQSFLLLQPSHHRNCPRAFPRRPSLGTHPVWLPSKALPSLGLPSLLRRPCLAIATWSSSLDCLLQRISAFPSEWPLPLLGIPSGPWAPTPHWMSVPHRTHHVVLRCLWQTWWWSPVPSTCLIYTFSRRPDRW